METHAVIITEEDMTGILIHRLFNQSPYPIGLNFPVLFFFYT